MILFKQYNNSVFQLQEYNPILVLDEWCCTSRVLAWESHWHQLCIWPAIVQIVGFYSKKNAWDIWKLIYSGTGGCISDERKGMILHLVVITCIHTCIFYFMTSVVIFTQSCRHFLDSNISMTMCGPPPPRRDFPKTLFPLEIPINLHTLP